MFKLSAVSFVALLALALAAPEPKAKPYFHRGLDAPVFTPYSGLPAPVPANLPGPLPAGLPYGFRSGLTGFPAALQAPLPAVHHNVVPAPFPAYVRQVAADLPQFAAPFHHRSVYPAFHQAVHHF